jgi:uncharacterized protein YecE (DUF72 family)
MSGTSPEADDRAHGGRRSPAAPPGGAIVRVGPAGWSYPDWEGVVYPRPRPRDSRPLELLVRLFPTIEVNVTFYRDVEPRRLEGWCRGVEGRPDFLWCFKLNRRLSHGGAPPDAGDLLRALTAFAPVRAAGRLGALLLQFPWSLRPSPANAAALGRLGDVAREAGWPLVIEVRHAGWAGRLPFAPVICDQPPLRGNLDPEGALRAALDRRVPGLDPLYVRLHGRNRAAWFDPDAGRDQRYDYLYGDSELLEWRDRLERAVAGLPEGTPVFVITNNHYQGQAAVNALQLQRLWDGTAPAVPDCLSRAYPRELSGFPTIPEAVRDQPGDGPGGEPADGGGRSRRRTGRGGPDEPTLF